MTDHESEDKTLDLVLEYELDAPPQKVWEAIAVPRFREKWLPGTDLANARPVSSEPGEEISYAMKEEAPPFLESRVIFQLRPSDHGGTVIRIIHQLADEQIAQEPLKAANNNWRCLMRAA